MYIKIFFTNCILKTTPSEQLFIPLFKTKQENATNNGGHKGNYWVFIIFSFEVLTQNILCKQGAIIKLFIKLIKIWLVQSLGLKIRGLSLSKMNTWLPSRWFIILIKLSVSPSGNRTYHFGTITESYKLIIPNTSTHFQ